MNGDNGQQTYFETREQIEAMRRWSYASAGRERGVDETRVQRRRQRPKLDYEGRVSHYHNSAYLLCDVAKGELRSVGLAG